MCVCARACQSTSRAVTAPRPHRLSTPLSLHTADISTHQTITEQGHPSWAKMGGGDEWRVVGDERSEGERLRGRWEGKGEVLIKGMREKNWPDGPGRFFFTTDSRSSFNTKSYR